MIRRLYLDNCFRHFDKTFTFENGLTGVVGPNESGKSLIVEMIRYALFGSKALRGKAEDYRKLHVELDFVVNGEAYTVIRKSNKVVLTGAVEVSGTRPVDEAIRRILGYDLNVFDVANSCNQGDVEALSNMRPADRKKMVDQTVGLTVLDELISYAGQEGNALKREVAAIEGVLVEPVEPVKPEGYRTGAELRSELEAAEVELSEYLQLKGYLEKAPSEPVRPDPIPIQESSEELERMINDRKIIVRSISNLEAQRNQLDTEEFSEAELDEMEQRIEQAQAWRTKQRLLAQGHHECPKCSHQWPVADLGELADVEEVEAPPLTIRQINEHRSRIGNNRKRAEIGQAIDELTETLQDLPDRSADLMIVQKHEAADLVYKNRLAAFREYNEGLEEKKARYAELQGIDQRVATLRNELSQSEQFERDLDRFTKAYSVFQEKQALVADMTKRAEDFLQAREVIQALKVSVKTLLLPSLNKVASVLLSRMTGGERYLVEVNEDFEITIDGQPINTLSGSGKAVANLAIRIALGQILTNRVFSIFMADEVDAAMDDERASHTADALQRLTETVGQVILVTHKRPETDHMVELKRE